jgi:hypothetical protein
MLTDSQQRHVAAKLWMFRDVMTHHMTTKMKMRISNGLSGRRAPFICQLTVKNSSKFCSPAGNIRE